MFWYRVCIQGEVESLSIVKTGFDPWHEMQMLKTWKTDRRCQIHIFSSCDRELLSLSVCAANPGKDSDQLPLGYVLLSELITVLWEMDFVIDQSGPQTGSKDYEVESVNRRQDSQKVIKPQISQSPRVLFAGSEYLATRVLIGQKTKQYLINGLLKFQEFSELTLRHNCNLGMNLHVMQL